MPADTPDPRFTSGGARSAGPDPDAHRDVNDRSLPELIKQLSEQTTTLLRQEVELAKAEVRETVDVAKAEMTAKGKQAGKGAGMLGAAAVIGLLAGGAFTAFLILILATFLAGWLAALIVTAVYGLIAGVLALAGKSQLQQVDPAPRETIATAKDARQQTTESLKEDLEWAKTQSTSARR